MICWRCHSNSVNTGNRLPICSDVKTRKRRNVVGIDWYLSFTENVKIFLSWGSNVKTAHMDWEFLLCTLTPEVQYQEFHRNHVIWRTKITKFWWNGNDSKQPYWILEFEIFLISFFYLYFLVVLKVETVWNFNVNLVDSIWERDTVQEWMMHGGNYITGINGTQTSCHSKSQN
jgi:hypothetical protein